MAMPLLSVPMFTLAIVTVAIFSLHATVTILLSWKYRN